MSWDELLRAGVRGATVSEITRNLTTIDPTAHRLAPIRFGSNWAGIWYAAKRARLDKVNASLMRSAIVATENFVRLTRLPFAPYLNIAYSKGNDAAMDNK
jgi:hypothetical protein